MSQDIPPSKRRRLGASAALSKPFKSPFRSIPTPSSNSLTPNAASANPSPHDTRPTLPQYPSNDIKGQKRNSSGSLLPISNPEIDPETSGLLLQKAFLRTQVTNLRAMLDGAKQALRIQRSGKDTELEALIIKWRFISQAAADEVFIGAKERVDRMGGVTAWRQRSMRDSSQWGFEDSEVTDETTPQHTDQIEKEEDQVRFYCGPPTIYWNNRLNRNSLWSLCSRPSRLNTS